MATSASPDAEVATDLSRLRTFVVADFLAAMGGVAFILVVWLTVLRSGWLLVLALITATTGGIMLLGLGPLRRGRVEPAVAWLAVANWCSALSMTAIASFAWPILVFAAVLPAVFSVPYVSRKSLHRYLAVSLAVATAVAALGVLQDVTGFTNRAPQWVKEAVLITFVPAMAALLVELSLASRAHLQRLLDAALGAVADLRRSETALAESVAELQASRARWWPRPTRNAAGSPATCTTGHSSG